MRLLRLDHLSGGRSIELDPRLTVLLGAPDDVVASIAELLRGVVTGRPVEADGTADLHGVVVGLRDRMFEVDGSEWVDPVLDLHAPAPLRLVVDGGPPEVDPGRVRPDGPIVEIVSTDPPLGTGAVDDRTGGRDGMAPVGGADSPHDPAVTTRRMAAEDLVRLRSELRGLDGERIVLAREAEAARGDLDSFARATLDVALGQLEALGARSEAADAEQERWDSERAARRSELTSRIAQLRAELASISVGESDRVVDALDLLVAMRAPTGRLDPVALGLAAELEDLRRSMESLEERRLAVEERLAEAEARLAEARSESDAARESLRSPDLDPELLGQLESVRDVIFDLEERGGRVAALRSRRRIDELRSEEAMLLDQLGFDTYSDYVMGRPNREAESMRSMRQDRAAARMERLSDEVDALRQELPGGSDDRWNREERDRLIVEAASILDTQVSGLSRLTTVELIGLLRSHEERPSPQANADILAASGRLAAALVAVGVPSPGSAADPGEMVDLARRWLSDEPARASRAEDLARELDEAERDLGRLDDAVRRPDDGGRSADLGAELRAIRARVADCEARVARHERATGELADLRIREIELRDRERDLLVRISDRERLLNVLGEDLPPPSDRVSAPDGPSSLPDPTPAVVPGDSFAVDPERTVESLRRLVDREAAAAVPVDAEWLLLARLGELRSVGRVGPVPLLLLGADPSATGAPALLHRVVSMSQLVQTIVVGDDEGLARWAATLGNDVTVTRW